MNKTKSVKEHITPIDDEKEYLKVLFELNALDDMDDWTLFQEQENKFHLLDSQIDHASLAEYFLPYRRRT